jgi:hypothetical protein
MHRLIHNSVKKSGDFPQLAASSQLHLPLYQKRKTSSIGHTVIYNQPFIRPSLPGVPVEARWFRASPRTVIIPQGENRNHGW